MHGPIHSLLGRFGICTAMLLACLASCGKSPAEIEIDTLTRTSPTIGNIDELLARIESTLKTHCNEDVPMARVLCGSPDAGHEYYQINPDLVARLSHYKKSVTSLVYSETAKECRARDGSGVIINFPYEEGQCVEVFSKINIPEYASQKLKEFPGKNPLLAQGRYDFKILELNQQAAAAKEAAESQKRLENWAVRAYEVHQEYQDKCWDQLENRGYGDPGCY